MAQRKRTGLGKFVFSILLMGLLFVLGSASAQQLPLRINAGGPSVGGWQSDAPYVQKGKSYTFKKRHDLSQVSGAAPREVYRTVRHRDHSYSFRGLANGKYRLRIHFIDEYDSNRSMHYVAEGQRLLYEFNIVRAAGGKRKAIVREFDVEVKDSNGLQIRCMKDKGNDVFEAGLEIYPLDGSVALPKTAGRVLKPKKEKGIVKLPKGFAIYSRGDAHERTLCRVALAPGMTSAQIRATEEVICEKGAKGGDIQGQISFDGKWLAFARSLGKASNKYGGDDYHDFAHWDIYVVPLTGAFPAKPIYVDRGYWPSWSEDSSEDVKTLYYSKHDRKPGIYKVTLKRDGTVHNKRLHATFPTKGYEGFAMAAPNGKFAAVRYRGAVYAYHFEGPLAGRKIRIDRGCHPHVTADSKWIFHAAREVGRADGSAKVGGGAGGAYHYGSSPDMEWFITRTDGGARDQNHGREVWLCSLESDDRRFETHKMAKITSDGSWVDVHAYGHRVSGREEITKEETAATELASADGLVFLWDNDKALNHVLDSQGQVLRSCSVVPKGSSRVGQNYAMDIRTGHFDVVDEDLGNALVGAVQSENQFALEAQIYIEDIKQQNLARIIGFSQDANRHNFILGQKGNDLVLQLRTTHTHNNGTLPQVVLTKVESGRPYHLVVSYKPGLLVWYINGVRYTSEQLQGDLANWHEAKLAFGNTWSNKILWRGLIRGVRIYCRNLKDKEVEKRWQGIGDELQALNPLVMATVRARLVVASESPTVDEVTSQGYRRCLVDHVYEVVEVVDGELNEKRIKVRHWSVLDAQAQPKRKVGDIIRMVLVPLGAHPELDTEYRSDTIDEFDLSEFYDIDS